MTKNLQKIIQDCQAWISAGRYQVVGYPAHDHLWIDDDAVVLTNPVIYHRTCERCGLRQERRGNSDLWTFDLHENIGHLVDRLDVVLRQLTEDAEDRAGDAFDRG